MRKSKIWLQCIAYNSVFHLYDQEFNGRSRAEAGKLGSLISSNNLVSRDEQVHRDDSFTHSLKQIISKNLTFKHKKHCKGVLHLN